MASILPEIASESDSQPVEAPPSRLLQRGWMRYALLAFGWLNVGLGAIGVVVPGMPTTIFLLMALWAFSKSSERFRVWLYNHKSFGPPLRAWHEHRAIPVKAKILAVAMMASSVAIIAVFVADNPMLPAIVGAILAPIAAFIVTRPSVPATET